MNTNFQDALDNLLQFSSLLRDAMVEAREEMTDEEFEAFEDGPIGEILCAAMDVEHAFEQIEEM